MAKQEHRAAPGRQSPPDTDAMSGSVPAGRDAPAEWETLTDGFGFAGRAAADPQVSKEEQDAPAADMQAAARALQNVLQSAGLPQNDTPLPALVDRVRRTQQLLRTARGFAWAAAAVVGLVMLLVFLHGYFSNVTLRVETPQVVQPDIRPPSSAGIRLAGEYIEVSLVDGSMPLDYDGVTAVRDTDGADVPVECDAARGVVRIPYQHLTASYRVRIADTGGSTYTFVVHVTEKAEET